MKKLISRLALSGAVLVIFWAAMDSTETNDSLPENLSVQDTLITGAELYRLNCAGCHGLDRKGNLPTYPSLIEIKDKLNKEEVRAQIKNGKGLMPPMAHLSDNEIDVINGFLYDEAEQEVLMTSLTPIKQGEMLFKSNCAGCHRATIHDPKPQNAYTKMCAMMEPSVLAGVAERFTKDKFLNILETGPCYMPSFSHMKQEEKEVLYAFLKTLEGKAESGHPTMGEKCAMMKKGKSCFNMKTNQQ